MRTLYFYENPDDLAHSSINISNNEDLKVFDIESESLGAKEIIQIIEASNNCIVRATSKYPFLLKNDLFWSKETNSPEIYFFRNDSLEKITDLTNRCLKEGHDIEKMWWSGCFDMDV